MDILDIKIDRIDLNGVIGKICGWLSDPATSQNIIATVNPEFVLAAQKNAAFKAVLNSAAISTCDGVGLIWAAKFLNGDKLTRVTGVELSEKLIRGECPGAKVFLLGGQEGVAKAVAEKYEPCAIVGYADGGKLIARGDSWTLEDNERIIAEINNSGANIILVAFGQVKQEMWIRDNLAAMPEIIAAIGVGGTFDYLAGTVKRAPGFFRRLGLEWLYRLVREPKRWRRIWNATVVFGWMILWRMLKNFLNLLKKINKDYSNLLLVLIALGTVYVAWNEYSVKNRPYVVPEIVSSIENQEEWHFMAVIINKGQHPCIVKITQADFIVGDAIYRNEKGLNIEVILSPNESTKAFDIGMINQLGRKKINNGEYKNNIAKIILKTESKTLGESSYQYRTYQEEKIDVSQVTPKIWIINEDMF